MSPKLERFAAAFDSHRGSCRGVCNCGKEFYNSSGGWDFEKGELAELESNEATDLDWSVSFIEFEGKEFVRDCDCWHDRAERIMAFLNGHHNEIAEYLNNEIKEMKAAANRLLLVAKKEGAK